MAPTAHLLGLTDETLREMDGTKKTHLSPAAPAR